MKNTLTIFTLLILICSSCSQKEKKWLNNTIDFSSLEERTDTFHMIQNDTIAGHWIWETQLIDDQIIFKDESVLTGIVEEKFDLVFDKKSMQTISVAMTTKMSNLDLKVDYKRSSLKDLKGTFILSGAIEREKKIDTIYTNNIIERSEVFGILPYVKNITELDEYLEVFFMNNASIGSMKLRYLGEDNITVSAGEFNVYKLSFEGTNLVSNHIYITKEFPRRIVKVDVLGQPLTLELSHL